LRVHTTNDNAGPALLQDRPLRIARLIGADIVISARFLFQTSHSLRTCAPIEHHVFHGID